MLSADDIGRFREAYRKSFGGEISEKEAAEMAERLYRLMKLIYKPMTKAELGKYRWRG